MATLRAVLAQVAGGRGQAVGIVGEPGMGKSRLLDEWRQHLLAQGVAYLQGHCLSYSSAMPYLPVLDLLRAHCGITPADGADVIAEKVRGGLQAVGMAPDAGAPYLLHLLGVGAEAKRLAGISPETLKAKTFETLRQMTLHSTQRHPLIIAVEDLHWIDPTSEEFFASLVEGLPGAALLFLGTYRPGYRPSWLEKSYATQLTLPPLSAQDSLQVLRTVLQREIIPPALAEVILAKAQGNPFFLEEIAQTLVDQGMLRAEASGQSTLPTPSLTDLQLPPTVQGVLAARIDRLAREDRHLLQCAAVVGTDVSVPLLQAIAELPETALHRGLAHLQGAEFLYETRLSPEHTYTFKHVLTREVAYGGLLLERRRVLHARIVEALEALAGDRLAEVASGAKGPWPACRRNDPAGSQDPNQVERLAHHALRGEVWEKALVYLWQAGEKALSRSAHREAVVYFEQALSALPYLPEQHDTRAQAIDLRLALRTALRPLGDNERILATLREAESCAMALDDPRRLGQVSVFLAVQFRMMGMYDQAIAAAQRARALATASGEVVLQALANQYLGIAYYDLGNYRRAIDCLGQTVAALDGAQQRERFGVDLLPAVLSRTVLAACHAELGTFAAGLALGEEGLRIAEAVAHLGSLMYASWGVGLLFLRQGDLPKALPLLERAVGSCQAVDFPGYFPRIAAALGTAYSLCGRVAEAVSLLTQALEPRMAPDRASLQGLCSFALGEAQMLAGRIEEAHALAEQTLARARRHQEQGREAYALCLLGTIAARRNPPKNEQAKAYYQQALTLADEFGMRPLLAHCYLGLGMLYSQTGPPEQARAKLSAAIALYRTMDMTFWLPQAEATLAQVV